MTECKCFLKDAMSGESIWKSAIVIAAFNICILLFGNSFFGLLCSCIVFCIGIGGICIKLCPEKLALLRNREFVTDEDLQKHCKSVASHINSLVDGFLATITWENPIFSFSMFSILLFASLFLRSLSFLTFIIIVGNILISRVYLYSLYFSLIEPIVTPYVDVISKKFNSIFERIPRMSHIKDE
ncbi:uncharacterized protein CMU_034050 [Cryptosporidium muris RN66]|uniref:Uncharacterized protein n=1 Tax=Cryptosporidium muris (strain RN66) TaxID=441375 RepID=B6AFM9_CRYMR|nr:uncharacterized protein CMU_034050 [Cryptosporidium muris RN66]EEA07020.1 hypothetical protein, conserved [Cryptosporidium muris RN66]|eukprot:XP_002141369.1 hypothetical protein [Cryptosporidium muris RN66]